MKKLLLVLLVVTLASFLFVGCLPGITPSDDEDEDEDEDDVTEVTVVIADSVVVDGKTYVKVGAHDITVTFPSAVAGNVEARITDCSGDYTKNDLGYATVVLFPDADRKIWTGSGSFKIEVGGEESLCCASYVEIISGECLAEVCIKFPVIVDGDKPFAEVKVSIDGCLCGDCELTFKSTTEEDVCDEDTICCGDKCSGLDSWSLKFYKDDPFDECCDATCEEPVYTCSGTACPIECTTKCLDAGEDYYVIATLADAVGNKVTTYGHFSFDSACYVTYEIGEAFEDQHAGHCVDWSIDLGTFDSGETITYGSCE